MAVPRAPVNRQINYVQSVVAFTLACFQIDPREHCFILAA